MANYSATSISSLEPRTLNHVNLQSSIVVTVFRLRCSEMSSGSRRLLRYTFDSPLSATLRSYFATSAVLMPAAILGTFAGVWLHKRVNDTLFYQFCYVFVFLTGCKLLFDGLAGVLG